MMRTYSASVIIPTYNMGWCITRAIKSCQQQSFRVNQIIVVDDASSDNTEEIVRSLIDDDPRINYCRHITNEGHLYAIGTGARQVACDWAALLDADDELTNTSIEARIGAAIKYRVEHRYTPPIDIRRSYNETSGNIDRITENSPETSIHFCAMN